MFIIFFPILCPPKKKNRIPTLAEAKVLRTKDFDVKIYFSPNITVMETVTVYPRSTPACILKALRKKREEYKDLEGFCLGIETWKGIKRINHYPYFNVPASTLIPEPSDSQLALCCSEIRLQR